MFVQKFYNVYAKVACYSLCVFICYAKIVVWFAEAHIHVHQINACPAPVTKIKITVG